MSNQQPTADMIQEWESLYTTDDPETGDHNWVDPDYAESEGYLEGDELAMYREYIAAHPTVEESAWFTITVQHGDDPESNSEECVQGVPGWARMYAPLLTAPGFDHLEFMVDLTVTRITRMED